MSGFMKMVLKNPTPKNLFHLDFAKPLGLLQAKKTGKK